MNLLRERIKAVHNTSITDEQLQQCEEYRRLLIEWNTKFNLTAITDPVQIEIKHFLDSFHCSLSWIGKETPKRLIDIGTGAGFPGIVLKILFPEIHVTLVESIHKKVSFIEAVIDTLHLKDIQVVHNRAEVVVKHMDYRGTYDIAIARAVTALPQLCAYLIPFVHSGGTVVAMKGIKADEELALTLPLLPTLQGRYQESIPYYLPGEIMPRKLILIQKV